ncbi:MAG: type VI secretion protein IcmF/TssM N-terminal domain-containing protein [Pseudomonadota bacterium]
MGKIGTFLLWVLALLLLALVSWGVTLFMQWPLWALLAVFFGVLGLYLLVRFAIRLVQVYRSRTRMAQLTAAGQGPVIRQMSPRAVLLRKWTAAVTTLRNSSLRRFGNPLYVLPWFMVVGKSGTGKTTALTRSRLASSIQKVNQSAPIQQTANYDWWFFDRAVVIDCAGRYVEAADLEQDRSEWELGLDLLAKYRGKEGLNGLVLAISTERLLAPDRDALIDEGRVIRERIEQLIRLFGKRFPVYILVTQCDRVYGLEQWARQLPENALEQAMGYLAEPGHNEPGNPGFIHTAFESIGERLQTLRVTLMARSTQIAPELLMFPNELQQLKPGLDVFLKACLGDNAYLETPFLRGLFFSSGLQEGGAMSSLLGHALPPVPRHTTSTAGLFLHDFFGRVLPQDRYISLPASLRNPWRSATQNLGLLSWLLLSTAIAILMTVAFVSNLETLRLLQDNSRFNPTFVGRIADDALTLEKIADSVALMEARNDNWRTEWMVESTNMDDLEDRLKSSFIDNFRKYILPTDDANYNADIERVVASDPGNEFPRQMRNIVRYINQLQARQRGADLKQLKAMPQREYVARYTPELYARLNDLYVANIAWSPPGDGYVSQRLRSQQQLLNRLAFNDPNLTWLTGLATSNPALQSVTVHDFWRTGARTTSVTGIAPTAVSSAFTVEGKKYIDSFLAEMERSIDNGPKFLGEKRAFEAWYKDQRLQAWQKFVADFPGTERTLSGEAEWRSALGLIAGAQSPYYKVMDRLNEEFAAEATDQLPGWLQLSRQLAQVRTQAVRLGAAGEAVKVVGAINTVGGKAMKEVLSGAPSQGESTIKNNLNAVATMQQFFTGINTVAADVSGGPAKAWQVAADFHAYGIDPAIKSSLLLTAADNLIALRKLVGFAGPNEEAVWQLMGAPLRFVLLYTEEQASCSLQKEWESKVDWPLQTAANMSSMVDQLYGAKGSVWAFADGPAKPFLTRDANRFGVVQTLGYSVPFTRQFLPMLNDAAGKRVEQLVMQQRVELEDQTQKLAGEKEQLQAQQSLAQVDRVLADIKQKVDALKAQVLQLGITTQPTSVNPGAKSKPFATVLSIQCASGARVISNFNFPVSDSFPLGDRLCGEVNLQIKIEDLVLSKKYPGANGVVRFLQDFRDGARQFNADEFPAARGRLDALGVRQIGVRYTFDGHDAILRASQQLETLDRQDKEKTAEKQRLQDAQFSQQQRGLQAKIASVNRPSTTEVTLPKQIGVCWDTRMTPHRPQDTQAMFRELVAAQLALPASPASSMPGTGTGTTR